MVLAKLYIEKSFDPERINTSGFLLTCFSIYLVGFVSSLFYVTTLFSNTLITIGLVGIFLAIINFIKSHVSSLMGFIRWIGVASFPVFLLHQPLMLWIGDYFHGTSKGIAEASFLILVFPVGWLIEKSVNGFVSVIQKISNTVVSAIITFLISLQVILNFLFFISGNDVICYADKIIFIINIFFIPLWYLLGGKIKPYPFKEILFIFIPSSVFFLFVLTASWFVIFWIFFITIAGLLLLVTQFSDKVMVRVSIPIIFVLFIFVTGEVFLRRYHPVEVNHWGEMPALQSDSSTVYSLIPGKISRLKYNNYDYYVKTNRYGFNGPESNLTVKDADEVRILVIGDAFTMPEGLEYNLAYPQLLQENLCRSFPKKKIVVLNGGVTGYGPNEMYLQLVKYIEIVKPDIYINQVFINEFSEINLKPEARLNDIGFREYSLRENLLSGYQMPAQIGSKIHKLLKDAEYKKFIYQKSLAECYDPASVLYERKTIDSLTLYIRKVKSLCNEKGCSFVMLYAPGQLEILATRCGLLS